jgi:hypothetical protein
MQSSSLALHSQQRAPLLLENSRKYGASTEKL